ncbi:hypothetical protein KXR83_08565 [Williamsia muralis]|uniref:hypothetical protein n=1 Tax=Williamsia marianensis TaxID=85044 RepID=UPI003F13EDA1
MQGNSFVIVFVDDRRETVTPRLSDTVAYSMVWKKHGWPSPTEDQLLMGVFTAFAAARREQKFVGNFESFQDQVRTVEEIAEDDDDPTEPAAPAPAPPTPAVTAPPTPATTPPPPPSMSPQEPAPIVTGDPNAIQAGHSQTWPSPVTTTPAG